MQVYVATFHGDLDWPPIVDTTLEAVLLEMQRMYRYGICDEYGWITPDPEDDKIEVWEYDTDAKTAKVVWGFWGWHWTRPVHLEYGIMPGNTKSLNELAEEK